MVKEKLLETPKGKVITLADGKDYQLSPLDLNMLCNLEEEFDCDIEDIQVKMMEGRKGNTFRRLLWIFLRAGYPELSKTDIGKLVPLAGMEATLKELMAALDELKV